MVDNLTIDLKLLKKSGLCVENFVLLQAISEGIDPREFSWIFNINLEMEILEQQNYIKIIDDSIEPRQKLLDIFQGTNNKINFDEFWDVFPTQTKSGRGLRSKDKFFGGKLTKDYEEGKRKYLSKVKNPEIHSQIIEILKARVLTGDIEYMNGIIPYINGRKWEVDTKYLTLIKRTNKILNE